MTNKENHHMTTEALRSQLAEAALAWEAARAEEDRLRQELVVLRHQLTMAVAAEAGWAVGDTYTFADKSRYQVDGFRLEPFRDGAQHLILLGWPVTPAGKRSRRRGEYTRAHDANGPLVAKVEVQP